MHGGMTFTKKTRHIHKNANSRGGVGNRVSNEWLWTKEGLEEQNQWVLIIALVEAPSPLVTTHQAWHW